MTKKAIFHFCLEFIPTFGFFIAAQLTDFFTATAILMILSLVSFAIGWITIGSLPTLPIIITLFVMVSGTITILYQSPDALLLSNSIYYIGFGLALLFGLKIKIDILKRIFEQTFAITDDGWHKLTIRWAMLLILIGIGNEIIRIWYTPEIWVTYKLITTIAMTTFAVSQLSLSHQYRIPDQSNTLGIRTKDIPH
jgi:intracellular septation protein